MDLLFAPRMVGTACVLQACTIHVLCAGIKMLLWTPFLHLAGTKHDVTSALTEATAGILVKCLIYAKTDQCPGCLARCPTSTAGPSVKSCTQNAMQTSAQCRSIHTGDPVFMLPHTVLKQDATPVKKAGHVLHVQCHRLLCSIPLPSEEQGELLRLQLLAEEPTPPC